MRNSDYTEVCWCYSDLTQGFGRSRSGNTVVQRLISLSTEILSFINTHTPSSTTLSMRTRSSYFLSLFYVLTESIICSHTSTTMTLCVDHMTKQPRGSFSLRGNFTFFISTFCGISSTLYPTYRCNIPSSCRPPTN